MLVRENRTELALSRDTFDALQQIAAHAHVSRTLESRKRCV